MTTLEALRAYYDFHQRYDTREGHRKKCAVWGSAGSMVPAGTCDCGGKKILDDCRRAIELEEARNGR